MSRSADFTFNQLIVLGLLKNRELYGLEIVKAAAAQTSASQASVGTIYPLLKDMVRDGWLSCRKDPLTHRTHYRLTELGLVHLSHVTAKWERVHDSLDRLLAGPAARMPVPEKPRLGRS